MKTKVTYFSTGPLKNRILTHFISINLHTVFHSLIVCFEIDIGLKRLHKLFQLSNNVVGLLLSNAFHLLFQQFKVCIKYFRLNLSK